MIRESLAVVTAFRCIASAFVCSVDYPRASSRLTLVTQRDLWSYRPLTSPFSFCALYCLPPVHTCNGPAFLWGLQFAIFRNPSTTAFEVPCLKRHRNILSHLCRSGAPFLQFSRSFPTIFPRNFSQLDCTLPDRNPPPPPLVIASHPLFPSGFAPSIEHLPLGPPPASAPRIAEGCRRVWRVAPVDLCRCR